MASKPQATVSGPVMLDLSGTELDAAERELLLHPAVGGVILFARNYQSPEQLYRLTRDIHEIRRPPLLIAIDQEGGRVQRCRDPFTALPPAAALGAAYARDPTRGLRSAEAAGWLMASELRSCGLDFSFAPVLDLDRGVSGVIGDRAFGAEPEVVSALAGAWIFGARKAGMASVGKHFPGHGGVAADSHHELPIDPRELAQIEAEDLVPFRTLATRLDAVMPAHVVYPAVDEHPAGFSPLWIERILRGQLGFDGAVFSDDLSMAGARIAGDAVARAQAALAAGCDMLLVCNNRADAIAILDAGLPALTANSCARLARLAPAREGPDLDALRSSADWVAARADVDSLCRSHASGAA